MFLEENAKCRFKARIEDTSEKAESVLHQADQLKTTGIFFTNTQRRVQLRTSPALLIAPTQLFVIFALLFATV